MKKLCVMVVITGALIALEWQPIGKIPVGRADDISIGYWFDGTQWYQRIYSADQLSWAYLSIDGGMTWDSLIGPEPHDKSPNPIAIVCDPNSAQNVWIARHQIYGNPGVFYSSNEGSDWESRSFGITNFNILTLEMAPDNPQHLFLGCSYAPFNPQPTVFVTTNGGITWNPIFNIPDVNVFDIETPSSISGVILIATSNGIYKTIDNGTTWYQTYTYSTKDLKINPLNSDEIYACVNEIGFYSIIKSNDAGETWQNVLNLPYYHNPTSIEITTDGKIYVSIWNSNIENNTVLYRSTNGIDWETIGSYNGLFDHGANIIKSDPQNPNFLVLGCNTSVYISYDGGNTWIQRDKGFREKYHADFSLSLPDGIYGGVSNGTMLPAVFKLINNEWKIIFSIMGIDYGMRPLWKPLFAHPLVYNKVFMAGEGGVDVGMLIFTENGGLDWKEPESFPHTASTNGQRFAYDPSNPDNLFMVCHTPEQLMISNDGGYNWIARLIDINGYQPNGLSIAVNPQNISEIYIGCIGNYSVVKTNDMGNTWERTGLQDRTVYSLEINPLNPQVVYAGTDYEVWRTKNGGDTWEHVSFSITQPPDPPYSPKTYTLKLDPEDPSIIYASLTPYPYENSDFYLSVDAGRKWFNYTYGLPSAVIKDIQIDIDFPDTVFVLTQDSGLYWTKTTWECDQLTSSSPFATAYNNGRRIAYSASENTLWTVYKSAGGEQFDLTGGIFISSSSDAGNTWSPKLDLGDGYSPVIDINPDADPYVVFAKEYKLYGIGRILPGNQWPTQPWLIDENPLNPILIPSFRIRRSDGIGFVTFLSGFWHDIKVAYFNTQVQNPVVEFLPNPGSGSDKQWVSLTLLGTGQPAVAYRSIDGGSRILFRYWTGIEWSPEEQVSPNNHIADYPFIDITPEGNPCVVWVHDGKVFFSKKIGEQWTPPLQLSPDNKIANFPQIAQFQSVMGVCWEQKPLIPPDNLYEIAHRIYMPATGWGPVEIIEPGETGIIKKYPNITLRHIPFGYELDLVFTKTSEPIYESAFRKKTIVPYTPYIGFSFLSPKENEKTPINKEISIEWVVQGYNISGINIYKSEDGGESFQSLAQNLSP